MTLSEITASNWQLSNQVIGQVAEGIEDIRQCIQTILTTSKGSDPLRPYFGTTIWEHTDKPIGIAAALISAEITTALNTWEPRIKLTAIDYVINGSQIDFTISAELIYSGETTEISFYIYRQNQLNPNSFGDMRAFSTGFDFGFS